jgi:hypothetical protein
MIETLINLGIMSILLFIANKMAIVNDISHEIRDILLKGRLPPSPPNSS